VSPAQPTLSMSSYSSDDEDSVSRNDAFGLSSLPATKKPRVAHNASKLLDSAPHVLAEVRYLLDMFICVRS
jgi:pre-mRNA-processing factor 17